MLKSLRKSRHFLFFSKVFEVRGISLNGLNSVDNNVAFDQINSFINSKTLEYLKIQKNILFFNPSRLKAQFLSENPVIESVEIKKKLMHELVFNFSERKPVGIWCFKNDCRYFDSEKVLWGNAGRSSGFLILSVQDERDDKEIPDDFFQAIGKVDQYMSDINLGLKVRSVLIPENSFDEFQVNTDRNYYLIFSLNSDLSNQIDLLKIFLNNKAGDVKFNPNYIDLRIDGRIYYK